MKKIYKVSAFCISMFIFTNSVYANPLDYGIFGGITEGRRLPKTTQQLLQNEKKNNKDEITSAYKEVIFLTGIPTEFEGRITINNKGQVIDEAGSYKVDYKIEPSEATADGVSITRNIEYNVNYRVQDNQTIKDYEVNDWKESIQANGKSFILDEEQSKSSISIIEDKTPAVNYYKGDVSHRAIYTSGEDIIKFDITGVIYGYSSAFGSTETQKLNCTIYTDDWQMAYEIKPSVTVNKRLEYSKNEPTAISFEGNFKEIMQNKSGLNYNITLLPPQFTLDTEKYGNASIPSFNTFEQLIAPDISHLKGHFAEGDIKKLFAMEILDDEPAFYKPNQTITRGQFTEMLVKAIKLPIKEQDLKAPIEIVFSDVMPDRKEYPYIMAAFEAELSVGKDNGSYHIDKPIQREEAITILIRTLGLENLGLENGQITTFKDDKNISNWAKREVYAANRIGIISGNENGKFNPKVFMSKAEAAAMINRLIAYMSEDMQRDYTENILNYTD